MKAPAFLFYVGDFLSSPDVQMMDTREVGAYCLLLFNAWQGDLHGHLPNNEDKLRRLAKLTPEQWEVSRELLLDKFPVADGGHTRYNPRLVAEAEKQAVNRAKKAAAGKQGGRPPKKQNESENNLMLSEEKQMLSKPKADDKQTESLSISLSNSNTACQQYDGQAGGQGSTSSSESQSTQRQDTKGGAAKLPKPIEYTYDEAPIFNATAFFAYLTEIGYPQVDKALYLLQIQAVGREKMITTTNDKWKSFIKTFLNNDRAAQKLILPPDATGATAVPRNNFTPPPTPKTTGYSIAAMVAENKNNLYL